MFQACTLHILLTADSPLTPEEIVARTEQMTEEERLDALSRYQENDPEA